MKKTALGILFICKHNRFRSKVAEALFKKYAKEKRLRISVKSAGTFPDFLPVAKDVIKSLEEFGVKKINRKPQRINKELIKNSDLIVIVADNVKKKDLGDLRGKKVVRWKISDTNQFDYNGILERVKDIDNRVKRLAKRLS